MASDLRIGSIPAAPPELLAADRAYYAPGNSSSNPIAPIAPLADSFRLHSRPTATKTIYLDFDGFTAVGTPWKPNAPLVSRAWDPDGNGAAFSDNELRRIQGIWQRVATDFTPFDVNVTTADPGQADLVNEGGTDSRWGIRVVFTPDTEPAPGAGGVAFIGSFSWGPGNGAGATDTPCYVFNMGEIDAAGAASHEVGHALGLSHDGTDGTHPSEPNQGYYTGHGTGENSWGPIMGVGGYYRNVTTWDNGVYFGANNGGANANFGDGPDDLFIISTENGFGYIPDQASNSLNNAQPLSSTVDYAAGLSRISQYGVIERSNDLDFFSFQTGTGIVNLSFDPYVIETFVKAPDGTITSQIEDALYDSTNWSRNQSSNLDISATLFDSNGQQIATSTPAGLRASFTNLSLSAGTYYVMLDGVGFGTPTANPPTGYSEYSSIGQYLVTGTVPVALGLILPSGAVVYTEDQSPIQVASSVTVFDGVAGDYADSTLAVSISPIAGATDRIGANLAVEGLQLTGNLSVTDAGQIIATQSQPSATRLTWTLTANATAGSIEKLVRSVTFEAQGNSPDTRTRSVSFQLSKGALRATDQIPIVVVTTNDAPLLVGATMAPIPEDSVSAVGQSVREIFVSAFSDPDPGNTLRGVAIVGSTAPAEEGVWQFFLSGAWQDASSVTDNTRLALDLNARLRFVPAPNFFGTPEPLMVVAIDNTYTGTFSRGSNLVYLPTTLTGPQASVGEVGSPLLIEVTPVNDAPQSLLSDVSFNVVQDQPLNGILPFGSFEDVDDRFLNYSATLSNGDRLPDWLVLDATTGGFSGTPSSLDVADLQVVLTASDSAKLKASLLVNIYVENVNDAPSQLRLVGNAVSENAADIRVGQLFSFDVDGDQVFWSTTDSRFSVRDGELFLNRALNFETVSERSITLVLTATDSGTPPKFSTLDVVVETIDINEFFPRFPSESFTVVDKTAAGSLAKKAVAVDDDSLQTVKYKIVEGDAEFFTLDSLTGELRFTSSVNMEQKAQYNVFVEAFDDGLPSSSTTAQFTINVLPKNEFVPSLDATAMLEFRENAPAGTVVGRIPVTDGDSNPLRFELLGVTGGARNWVEVDPETGIVRLTDNHRFDFEANVNHSIQVRVTEAIANGSTISGDVSIKLTNANDLPTGINQLTIHSDRQGSQATSDLIVQDQDLSPTGYSFSTSDSRFEVRNGRLALKSNQFIESSLIGQTLSVPLQVVDKSDPNSVANLVASVAVSNIAPWQNPTNPLDANKNGRVSSEDALIVISRLNARDQRGRLSQVRAFSELESADVDINGDRILSALDALIVISAVNRRGSAEFSSRSASGEASISKVADLQKPSPELWHSAFQQLEDERIGSRRKR